MTRKKRAPRGEVGLVLTRAGTWGIRWGRRLARERGVSPIEATGHRDRAKAARVLEHRLAEVLGDGSVVSAEPMTIHELIAGCLRAYKAGLLPGRTPRDSTVQLGIDLLLGARRGLQAFANGLNLNDTSRFDEVFVMRWLELRARLDRADTVRACKGFAVKLASFGKRSGVIPPETEIAIRKLRVPPAARGRARTDGVPSDEELDLILAELRPRRRDGAPYDHVAELQLRLGLRPSEVVAVTEDWLDEEAGCVRVRASDSFQPKDGEERDIDGVDSATFALARHVIALKRTYKFSSSAYKQAFRRACRRLAARGNAWRYRSKRQALRAAHATVSRRRGVPLSTVAIRLGHSSERTTERSYLGVQRGQAPNPFEGVPVRTLCTDQTSPTRPRRGDRGTDR